MLKNSYIFGSKLKLLLEEIMHKILKFLYLWVQSKTTFSRYYSRDYWMRSLILQKGRRQICQNIFLEVEYSNKILKLILLRMVRSSKVIKHYLMLNISSGEAAVTTAKRGPYLKLRHFKNRWPLINSWKHTILSPL